MSDALIKVSKFDVSKASPCAICRTASAEYTLETTITIKTFGFSGTHQISANICPICKSELHTALVNVDRPPAPAS